MAARKVIGHENLHPNQLARTAGGTSHRDTGQQSCDGLGGGIGENDPLIRQRIGEGLDGFGRVLDPVRNAAATGVECRFSRDAAPLQAWVVPVDEAALMTEAAAECLR